MTLRSKAAVVLRCWRRVVGGVLIFGIRAYQFGVRPLLVGTCRFHPSCSEYAIEAVRIHGPWRGAILAARRLGRCHPARPGGYDPLPPVEQAAAFAVDPPA